jgi:hypothetical protein
MELRRSRLILGAVLATFVLVSVLAGADDAKVKKDKDRDPSASTNKTKGMHKAKGHRH